MTDQQIALNFLSYAAFTLAPWIAWFSKGNTPALVKLPFLLTAYALPLLIFPFSDLYDQETIALLTQLNTYGSISFVFSIWLGSAISRWIPTGYSLSFRLNNEHEISRCSQRVCNMLLLANGGLFFCFLWMGVIPAFADDVFSAKFFKGPYKEKYDQISILYRLSQFCVITLLPLSIALFFHRKTRLLGSVMVASMTTLALGLTRGPVLEGLLLYIAIVAGRSRSKTTAYVLLSTIIYTAGSLLYIILGLDEQRDSIEGTLTSGLPDIFDQLTFLNFFDLQKDVTYGATFWGGLIPGNTLTNPSIYSLAITNPGTEVTDITSGGFRMPPSLWGYTAFGLLGTIFTCALSGLVVGAATKQMKRLISKDSSALNKMLAILWFQVIAGFMINFYTMAYYGLISIATLLLATGKLRATKMQTRTAKNAV